MQINTKFSQEAPPAKSLRATKVLPKRVKRATTTYAASIEFGKLNEEAECVGIGICRVNMATTVESPCKQANALLFVTKARWIGLRFRLADLSPCLLKSQFANPRFALQNDVPVAADLCAALGCASLTLKKGVYPVERKGDFLELQLRAEWG